MREASASDVLFFFLSDSGSASYAAFPVYKLSSFAEGHFCTSALNF